MVVPYSPSGISLVEGVAPGAISENPVPPVTFNAKLYYAAGLHSEDMLARQYYGHNSPNGTTPYQRIQAAGYQYAAAGENLGVISRTAPINEVNTVLAIHDGLFVDEGVPGRGHRVNILDPRFKEIGAGVAFGPYSGFAYSYMLTCDFGASSEYPNPFLLGVVYDDSNSDGIYNAGEGMAGVTITVVETGASTINASAGGYAILIPAGEYTVRAVLADTRYAEKQVSVAGNNIKVDFLLSEFVYPKPVAAFSVAPVVLAPGGTATLAWAVTNAQTITIDQGIGAVTASGNLVVTPAATTTYTLTATGHGGTITETASVAVLASSTLGVEIVAPLNGETIAASSITVEGMVVSQASEIGVTVNGVVALVDSNRFVANHVPLTEGANLLTVKATDSLGQTVERTITVTRVAASKYIKLLPGLESGLAPLSTTLRVDANFTFAAQPVIDYDGSAGVTISKTAEENVYNVTIPTPGFYLFTVEALDENGVPFVDSVAVLAMDKTVLDTLLKAKWEGMKTALAMQDVEGGLAYFLETSHGRYRNAFNALGTELPQLVADMQNIELILAINARAKYRIKQSHDINGSPVTLTYYIYFVKDQSGFWKIEQY